MSVEDKVHVIDLLIKYAEGIRSGKYGVQMFEERFCCTGDGLLKKSLRLMIIDSDL